MNGLALKQLAVVVMVAAVWSSIASAQTLKGIVLEDSSDRPIDAAQVSLLDEQGRDLANATRTGATGAFTLHAPRPGSYRVRALRIGYQPATSDTIKLGFGEVVTVRLRMTVVSQRLAAVSITERRRFTPAELTSTVGFELRRKQPYGVFWTAEELDRLYDIRDIGRSARVGGLTVSGPNINEEAFAFVRSNGGGCNPALYLDGIRVGAAVGDPGMRRNHAVNGLLLLASVSPDKLYGVEVYRPGRNPPLRTAGWLGGSCGIIAVWTKLQVTRDSLAGILPGTTRPGVQVIRGVVVDADTERPVAGVDVRLLSDELHPVTDRARSASDGSFVIRTDRIGQHRLQTTGDSLRSTMTPLLGIGAEELLIVRLFVSPVRPVATPLGISVRAGPNTYSLRDVGGFAYRRARAVTGAYFDTYEIERRRPRTLGELLSGIDRLEISGTPPADTIAFRRTLGSVTELCRPTYLMDGVPLADDRASTAVGSLEMGDVVAVEVHPDPAAAPAVFAEVIGACGLIAIWTSRAEGPPRPPS